VSARITAHTDHWRLDNLSPAAMLIEDLENPRSAHFTVPARRTSVVVQIELGRVSAFGIPLVTVFGPEPQEATAADVCPAADAIAERDIDVGSTHFAVLRALCDGHRRNAFPTSAQIVDDLRAHGVSLTTRAVDGHIEYLTHKLGLRPPPGTPPRGSRWRNASLAHTALRVGLVTDEDLRSDNDQGD
jgi:hypothetical protein